MQQIPTVAVRLDHALDELAAGAHPALAAATAGLAGEPRVLVEVADRVRSSLPMPPVSSRFEARLGARLSGAVPSRDAVAWALRHPGRLIVTGAVGSAVGVGVTAYAVWRKGRRSTPAGRFLHR
jgi:hypothetical protein